MARVADADAQRAEKLGFTGGVLPGAHVRARRGVVEHTDTADSNGRVTFTGAIPGAYQISVLRALTDEERARLEPADMDITAFGGGTSVNLSHPATEAVVVASSTRRGSLVISEVFGSTWLGNQDYLFGTFVELYNNSDSTIFLDGKLFGLGPFHFGEAPQHARPCSVTQQWQADPDGLWSPTLYRLPGTGQQYPLHPREAAVMATDAVDHSVVDSRWPDLSGARLEFLGQSDVDNPAAGNITYATTPAWDDLFGHGPWFSNNSIWFIADDIDVGSLPVVQPPNYRVPIPRVPRDKILDVTTFMDTPAFYAEFGIQLCPELISSVFDAGPAFWRDPGGFMSFVRRPLGVLLLRSGSTVNDFEIVASPTPGQIP